MHGLVFVCRSIKSSETPHRSFKQSKQNTSGVVKPQSAKGSSSLGAPIKLNNPGGSDFTVALPAIGEALANKEAQETKDLSIE